MNKDLQIILQCFLLNSIPKEFDADDIYVKVGLFRFYCWMHTNYSVIKVTIVHPDKSEYTILKACKSEKYKRSGPWDVPLQEAVKFISLQNVQKEKEIELQKTVLANKKCQDELNIFKKFRELFK